MHVFAHLLYDGLFVGTVLLSDSVYRGAEQMGLNKIIELILVTALSCGLTQTVKHREHIQIFERVIVIHG